ncbi:MAG TPA: hypothetical protein VHN14_26580 [Kofleriaceae bacterium]|jgi:hypothetical protein|nr:hypothetical protein [Kofleriaceae bacterium]
MNFLTIKGHPWKPDYHLEFYGRHMGEVSGEVDDSGNPPVIKGSSIVEILTPHLP